MNRLEALILCDLVVRGPDGKVQLQGLFDRIRTASLPAAHRMAWLFFKFYTDPPRQKRLCKVGFTLTRPDRTTERLPEMKMEVPLDGHLEGQVALQNLPLYGEGQHMFTLLADEAQVGSCIFTVEMIATPQPRTPNDSLN